MENNGGSRDVSLEEQRANGYRQAATVCQTPRAGQCVY